MKQSRLAVEKGVSNAGGIHGLIKTSVGAHTVSAVVAPANRYRCCKVKLTGFQEGNMECRRNGGSLSNVSYTDAQSMRVLSLQSVMTAMKQSRPDVMEAIIQAGGVKGFCQRYNEIIKWIRAAGVRGGLDKVALVSWKRPHSAEDFSAKAKGVVGKKGGFAPVSVKVLPTL